jgi:CheY-like chemotaxis protein
MSPTILVIEDEADERDALRAWLEHHGHRVEAAGAGREALDMLAVRLAPPALILLDLHMPRMDGWHFLATLALHAAWRHVPVLVTSSTIRDGDVIDLPTVAFASKPLRPDALQQLIEGLLAPSPLLDAAAGSDATAVPVVVADEEDTQPFDVTRASNPWKDGSAARDDETPAATDSRCQRSPSRLAPG